MRGSGLLIDWPLFCFAIAFELLLLETSRAGQPTQLLIINNSLVTKPISIYSSPGRDPLFFKLFFFGFNEAVFAILIQLEWRVESSCCCRHRVVYSAVVVVVAVVMVKGPCCSSSYYLKGEKKRKRKKKYLSSVSCWMVVIVRDAVSTPLLSVVCRHHTHTKTNLGAQFSSCYHENPIGPSYGLSTALSTC